MGCDRFHKYLDGRRGEIGEDLEQHLKECPACRSEVESWRHYRSLFKAAACASEGAEAAERAGNIVALYAMKTKRRLKTQRRITAVAGSMGFAAAAAALIVVVFTAYRHPGEGERAVTVQPPPGVLPNAGGISAEEGAGVQAAGKGTSVIRTSTGSLILVEGSVIRTAAHEEGGALEIELISGQLLARTGDEPQEQILVTADTLKIRASVSALSVTLHEKGAAVVEVMEGSAEVSAAGMEAVEVSKGECARFEPGAESLQVLGMDAERAAALARMLEAVAEPSGKREGQAGKGGAASSGGKAKGADYAAWKEMIVGGRLEDALTMIESHLAASPDDAKAWTILGDAKNLAGDFEGARSAYLKASQADSGAVGANALFKASVLLDTKLKDLDGAEKGFVAYLSLYPSGPLAEQARLHLVKILIKTNRTDAAKKHLKVLVEMQPGPAQKEAIELLGKLEQ